MYVRTYVCTVVVPFNEGVHSELGQSSPEMQIKFVIRSLFKVCPDIVQFLPAVCTYKLCVSVARSA